MQSSKLNVLCTRKLAYYKGITRTILATKTYSSANADENLKSWKQVPGPKSLPILGQLLHFLPGGEMRGIAVPGSLQKLFDKYGPIIRFNGLIGMEPMIVLGDAEISAHVLRSENTLPIRTGFASLEYYRRGFKESKGQTVGTTGLVSDHGEVWKEFRSTVNPVLLQPKTIKLYSNVIDEVALDMIERLKADRDEKNMIRRSFDLEMNLWALESIGTVALGCRLNCLSPSLSEDAPEKKLIRCIHDVFTILEQLDFRPNMWRYVSTPLFRKAMKLFEHHETLTKYFVQKGIEQLEQNVDKNSDHEKGVLEKLLEINKEYAYIIASDMLVAGVDTAANTIIATLYLLAKHQDKQDKLREEILSKADRRPYLKACIKESLRIMPVVSGNIRRTTKEYNLKGYRIPKDFNIIFAHYEMSLMEQYYPRPKEYIPERWVAEKNDPLYYGNAHPFAHSPFGFGARSCIGRRIAELEMETFLARFIENFKVDWFGPPPKVQQASIIYVKPPFNFIFTDVKK